MEDTEKRLYEAAVDGNTVALQELLENDGLILERITLTCFNETPLHIAAMRGHVEFAAAILDHSIQLASELDSRKLSPLHMASVKGYVQMVKLLVSASPEMCVARDRDGRNPLHLAAIKGRLEVMKELLRTKPEAAYQRTDSDETVLHLCVKHNQLEALKMILETTIESKDDEYVNAVDSDGNTILHLPATHKQTQTMKSLLRKKQADVNGNGKTVIDDTLAQGERDIDEDLQEEITGDSLPPGGGAMRAVQDTPNNRQAAQVEGPRRKRGAIMVAASVLATMTFQAGLTPPGGVWINNDSAKYNKPVVGRQSHKAGEAVMSYNRQGGYQHFFQANTLAFIASLTAVLLELSGLNPRWIEGCLRLIMWFTVTSIVVTYAISTLLVTSHDSISDLSQTVKICIAIWCIVMTLVVHGNTLRRLYMSKPWLGIARRVKNIVMRNNYWRPIRHVTSLSGNV